MKWTFGLLAFFMIVSLAFAGLPLASRQLAMQKSVATPGHGERILETPNWVISVRPLGRVELYSVYSRKGHPLPLGLSDAQIALRYPDLYRGLHAPLTAYRPLVEAETGTAETGTEAGISSASVLR